MRTQLKAKRNKQKGELYEWLKLSGAKQGHTHATPNDEEKGGKS